MFGKVLEKLLKDNGLSIRQFSQKIGVSPKTAQEWVGKEGRFPSSPDIIKKIADLFEVSVHELLFGETDPRELVNSLLNNKTEIHTGLYEITIKKVNVKK